ncbi:ArsC family reductase [Leeia sp. TBRC 13508]|uniref:ArsC family reductase n=1 Tax=Leeia speluncae TaxID=2884804 RepID=A0ABS8DB19_9NEIS|nr:ArsC family reductase [Leeia speluncae]MCB6185359.1 ArsC family reductase [Leeia speluncae]
MSITIYGIPNCNTVKKARVWLTDHQVDATFHDFKKQGVTEEMLAKWLTHFPWEKLVNRAGTTWRQLTDEQKAAVNDNASAIALMLEKPSVIKRPVIVEDNIALLGFDEAAYSKTFL